MRRSSKSSAIAESDRASKYSSQLVVVMVLPLMRENGRLADSVEKQISHDLQSDQQNDRRKIEHSCRRHDPPDRSEHRFGQAINELPNLGLQTGIEPGENGSRQDQQHERCEDQIDYAVQR